VISSWLISWFELRRRRRNLFFDFLLRWTERSSNPFTTLVVSSRCEGEDEGEGPIAAPCAIRDSAPAQAQKRGKTNRVTTRVNECSGCFVKHVGKL
jgi:hypothetical protein